MYILYIYLYIFLICLGVRVSGDTALLPAAFISTQFGCSGDWWPPVVLGSDLTEGSILAKNTCWECGCEQIKHSLLFLSERGFPSLREKMFATVSKTCAYS